MASEQEYRDAAKKAPSTRTDADQALVDRGQNMQSVRNEVAATERRVKIHGE